MLIWNPFSEEIYTASAVHVRAVQTEREISCTEMETEPITRCPGAYNILRNITRIRSKENCP